MRARARGFTLVELMVVVVLIAVLALMAMPTMAAAREDRLAFRTADTFARLLHESQTRALGRGAAQLVVITSAGTTDRGSMLTFETLDAAGRPISSCRNNGGWAGVPAGSALNPLLGGENLNAGATSMQVVAGLETVLQVSGVAKAAVVVCFTPGGRVYVVDAADVATALPLLPIAAPFTGDVIFQVFRRPGGVQSGLTRQVIMTANGATRLHSI